MTTDDRFTTRDAQHIIATQEGKKVTLTRRPSHREQEVVRVRQVAPETRFVPEAFEGLDEVQIERIQKSYKEAGYGTTGSAAFDLRYVGKEPLTLQPGEMVTVHSGLAIYLRHPNLVGLILPRSGLGCKGVVLGNLVGVIDSDYQGELKLALWNRHETETEQTMTIEPGERVAQYIVTDCYMLDPTWVEDFGEATERGENGFGHTGTM
jgi:dUTP pyrophosphatase